MKQPTALLFLLLIFLSSCGNEMDLTPKPRAFPRVIYPEKSYRPLSESACPFTFEYPVYAKIQQDSSFFEQAPAHPCWFDIYFPDFDSRIHCSYYDIGPAKSLERLKEDAFEMADWHNKRANYIEEIPLNFPDKRVYGIAFQIEGPAASGFQFYLTDSTDHFLRGALYFNAKAQPDSLAPVAAFVRKDIERLIGSFNWK